MAVDTEKTINKKKQRHNFRGEPQTQNHQKPDANVHSRLDFSHPVKGKAFQVGIQVDSLVGTNPTLRFQISSLVK